MDNLDIKIIERLAVLETQMTSVLDAIKGIDTKPSSITTMDKIKYGGLIAAVTALINVVSTLLQGTV